MPRFWPGNPKPHKPSRSELRKLGQIAAMLETIIERHACDRCGFSRNDGGVISFALFRVSTPEGEIFLCGHHFRKHRHHIHERAYETTEL